MNRSALAPALTLLLSATLVTTTFARQATPAATKPATPAATSGSPPPAAAKAKFATPLKGEATIDVIQGASKIVGKEVVKTYKIKNTSSAPIAMLKVDEYYYSKTGAMVSSAVQRHKQPFLPGEVIELTTTAPLTPGVVGGGNRAQFSHMNGTVKVNPVKAIK
jgi:hypothetical protein